MVDERIEKIEKEIERSKLNNGRYWFDFDISHELAIKIKNHFEKKYVVELKPCKSCGGQKYEVIMYL